MNRPLYMAHLLNFAEGSPARVGQSAPAGGVTPMSHPSSEGGSNTPAPLDDMHALAIVNRWRQLFPDAAPLPGIGMPSQNKGVLTLTHTMTMPGLKAPPMLINGLPSNSPLANNALYSAEVTNGRWLNLYEIMLPEFPGVRGGPSAVQRYVNTLQAQGVDVAGNHYHWSGGTTMGHFPIAVHSQSSNLEPMQFVQAHINAIHRAMQPQV